MSGGQQSNSAAGSLGVGGALTVTGSEVTAEQGTLFFEGDEGYALTGEGMTMSGGAVGISFTIDLPT